MRKLLALAALVLGLASCQTEPEGLDVNVGGEVDTVVTVSLPETETRAADSAEGAFVNVVNSEEYTIRYILQVYYGSTAAPQQVIYSDEKSVSFPVRLVSGRTYSFVAWADVAKKNDQGEWEAMHYNTANLEAVTFNDNWNAMDETFDAFTDVKTVVYNGTTGFNLNLTRPFAKLRVLTTDMIALNNLGIVPDGVYVKYNVPVYDKFDALSGNVITTSSIDEKVFAATILSISSIGIASPVW